MCVYAGSAPVIDLTADSFHCNIHVAKDLHLVRAAQGVEQSRVEAWGEGGMGWRGRVRSREEETVVVVERGREKEEDRRKGEIQRRCGAEDCERI